MVITQNRQELNNSVVDPIVTVLMAVYNASSYLNKSIESILSQTFSNFIFLIIDDGSTDNSVDIIRSFQDPRICLILNVDNTGLIETLNRGIKNIQTRYTIRQDADDYSHPGRLQKLVDYMENHQECVICSSNYQNFGDNDQAIYKPESNEAIKVIALSRCPLAHCASIIRVEEFKRFNLYYDKEFIHAEDYDMLTRASLKVNLHNIQDLLYYYRCHNLQVSRVFNSVQLKNEDIIRENFLYQSLGIKLQASEFLVYKKLIIPLELNTTNNELLQIIDLGNCLLSTNIKVKTFDHEILSGIIKQNISRILYIRIDYIPGLILILIKAYKSFGIFMDLRKFVIFFVRCIFFYSRKKNK